MKKTLRKLTLSRETLRGLDNVGLSHAAGGHSHRQCPFSTDTRCTGDTCECTRGCNTIPCTTA